MDRIWSPSPCLSATSVWGPPSFRTAEPRQGEVLFRSLESAAGGVGRLCSVTSAMRARRAAIGTTTPNIGRAGRTRTGVLRNCGPANKSSSTARKYLPQLQVARRRNTCPCVRPRGLRVRSELVKPAGFAPAPCGLKIRCADVDTTASRWCARRESHPGLRTGRPPRCCYATRAINSAPAGLGPPAGFRGDPMGRYAFPASDRRLALARANSCRKETFPRRTGFAGCEAKTCTRGRPCR